MVTELGRALKRHREAAGLSQTQLARKAGVTGEYISMLEAGKKGSPSLPVLRRLAAAVRVSLAALVAGREQLEVFADGVVAAAGDDSVAAMTAFVRELERQSVLIRGNWEFLWFTGSKSRRRAQDVVEIARGFVSRIPPLNDSRDPRIQRTIAYLAQGLADVLEEARKRQRAETRKNLARLYDLALGDSPGPRPSRRRPEFKRRTRKP